MGKHDIGDEKRGSGRTHHQIEAAPLNAIFVCINRACVEYSKGIAHKLGRRDLRFETLSILENGAPSLRGRRGGVVLDHACFDHMTNEQSLAFYEWTASQRAVKD